MIIDTLVTNARASCMFVNVENDLPVFRISEGKTDDSETDTASNIL